MAALTAPTAPVASSARRRAGRNVPSVASPRRRTGRLLVTLALVLVGVAFLVPLAWIVLASLDPAATVSVKLPESVTIARDIATMGNTSAASVPLALERLIESGEAASGDTALLIAFGAGLVYAAQVVIVP